MSYDVQVANPATSFGLETIDQVAFLVRDMDEAAQVYGALFGPLRIIESELSGATFRGRPAAPKVRVAFANHGEIEVELIQPLSGEGPFSERLQRHGEGLFHLRFPVDDIDATTRSLTEGGFEPVFSCGVRDVRVVYFEAPQLVGSAMIELISGPPGDLRHAARLGF
jgi:catechol 2,3-dioxygenase-like lactoylglutathione lyase family enzyme